MATDTVSMLEGNTFVVSDKRGDIEATPTETVGLFAWDTRFLSRWRLTVDGKALHSLATDDVQYFSAEFFLVPETGPFMWMPSSRSFASAPSAMGSMRI